MEIPLHLQPLERGTPNKISKEIFREISDFRPQQGDIVIRDIRYRSPAPSDHRGKFDIYNEEMKTTLNHGDLLLRFGHKTPDTKWQFTREVALFLLWQERYERSGKWFKVAETVDPVVDRGCRKPEWVDRSLRFPSPDDWFQCFGYLLYEGDYVVVRQPGPAPDVPWATAYAINVVHATYDAREAGKDFGDGDVLVRVVAEGPRLEAHGLFNLGEFVNWCYMGKRNALLR